LNEKYKNLIFILLFIFTFALIDEAKVKVRDLPEKYRKWLEEEVVYIITPKEKEVFLELQNNHERDLFIEAFWKHRDPTPGNQENEYREEHYRRIKYANRMFRGTGKPGWKTDRGKVYIILGEPKDIRIFNGTDAYYPAEMWHYQNLEGYGLPQAFHLLFYQKGRIGDYILYHPAMDGPWNLMSNYKGDPGDYLKAFETLYVIEPELSQASISLIPGESVMHFPSMASSLLLNNIDIAAQKRVRDKYAEEFMRYKDIIEVEYSTNYIDSDSLTRIIQDQSGINFIHYSIELSNISLSKFENSIYTNLEFNGIVTDKNGKTIFQFEKSVPLKFTEEQYKKMRHRPFNFCDRFPLLPGDYKFSLIVKNSVSKEFTSFEKDISISEDTSSPLISPLILGFNTLRRLASERINNAFVVRGIQLYCQPGNKFIPKDKLYVFFQIIDIPEELKEKGSLKYIFYKEEEEVFSAIHSLKDYSDSTNFLEEFSLEKFLPGYYKIKVFFLDERNHEIISAKENFEISPVTYLPRPWFHSKSFMESGEPEIFYIIGRQFINKEDYENARIWLEKAYQQKPTYFDYAFYLAQANFYLKKYKDVLKILEPFSGKSQKKYELYYLLAKSYQALSEFDKAIHYFDAAISNFGLNINLLNSIGECYYQLGNIKKAIATWEKSLEVDPKQEKIKELVRSLKK